MKFISYPSKNFNDRAKNSRIEIIVLHATGTNLQTSLAILSGQNNDINPSGRVSAHYLIAENGDIYAMVSEDKRAWHAGISQWGAIQDVNSYSIGIELVNNHKEFQNEFTEEQIESLVKLIKNLQKSYNIMTDNIVGHSDIAPDRKTDPGNKFPWDRLRQELGHAQT